MVAGVLPLTFSGAVEPRLLYVPEIGMATVVAGVAAVYVEAVAAARHRRVLIACAAGALAAVLIGTTLVSTVRAQRLFREGTQKKLDGEQIIYEQEATYRVIPPEHRREIEAHLTAAGRPLRPASK
jgi:hypothetical protein